MSVESIYIKPTIISAEEVAAPDAMQQAAGSDPGLEVHACTVHMLLPA